MSKTNVAQPWVLRTHQPGNPEGVALNGEGAIVPDGAPTEPGSPSDYVPTARPGARLPHAWLDGPGGRSTLDLVPIDRSVVFTFGHHDRWAGALGDARAEDEVVVVRVGVDTSALDAWGQLCGVDDGGALLVRPDQHVRWRARTGSDSGGLGRALHTIARRADAEVAS